MFQEDLTIKKFPIEENRIRREIIIYLLDHKIPKYLLPLSGEMIDLYMQEYGEKILNKVTANKKLKIRQAMDCFCYNAVYHLSFFRDDVPVVLNREAFSLPLIYNGVLVNRKVSYTYTKSILDWLHWSGRAELHKGRVLDWHMVNGKRSPLEVVSSKLILGEELADKMKEYCDKRKILTARSVVEVRDKDKKAVVKKLGEYQKEIVGVLNHYNELTRTVTIAVDEDVFDIQLKKVYSNESFEDGGRNYIMGSNVSQDMMKRDIRPKITIDGEATVELDFKALHPRLAATIEGVELNKDFDPYSIELVDYDPKVARYFAKWATLILLNTGIDFEKGRFNVRRAQQALSKALREDGKQQGFIDSGLCPKYIDLKGVIAAVLERNDYIRLWFHEPRGLLLQNIDSRIIDLVIGHFNKLGEIIIPIHDSIIVKESYLDEGINTMIGCFEQVMGSSYNCIVEKK